MCTTRNCTSIFFYSRGILSFNNRWNMGKNKPSPFTTCKPSRKRHRADLKVAFHSWEQLDWHTSCWSSSLTPYAGVCCEKKSHAYKRICEKWPRWGPNTRLLSFVLPRCLLCTLATLCWHFFSHISQCLHACPKLLTLQKIIGWLLQYLLYLVRKPCREWAVWGTLFDNPGVHGNA